MGCLWVLFSKSLLKRNNGRFIKNKINKGVGEHWREGLAMFLTVDWLQADTEEAFNNVE